MAQFRFLWSRALPHSAGYDLGKQRVLQRLADRSLFGTDKKLSQSQWDDLIQRALDAGQNDFDIYSLVREKTLGTTLSADLQLVLPEGSASAPSSGKESNKQEKDGKESGSSEEGGDGRAMHMVNMTVECIPASLRDGGIAAVLDYGCAEGAITAELGRKLKLPADKVFGADVRSIPSVGFTFMPLQAEDGTTQPQLGSILPALRDGSVDLVTTAMVLHHVTHVSAILLELRRVISNKGVLVLREHHCVSPDGGAFLDITHGLYSLSWSSPIEWPDFLSEYKAFYRSREEWNALVAAAGFTLLTRASNEAMRHYNAAESSVMRANGKIPNVIKAYYAVYAPDPRFVFPTTATTSAQKTQPVEAAAKRDLAASEGDVRGNAKRPRIEATATAAASSDAAASPELFESKKYPGRFYRIDPATGATVWV